VCVLAAGALGGCQTNNPLNMRPGAKSILESIAAEPSPAEAVDMALDKYDANRRYRGTLLLANAYFGGQPPYLDLFERHLGDPDPGVRSAAARALGLHGRPEHAPRLAALLADPDPLPRGEAARALQRLHNPRAIDALVERLDAAREPEYVVRAEAATALGQYPERRVVEKLIASLADDSLAVNAACAGSLRTLTGQDFGFDRAGWQRWYEGASAPFAAQAVYVYRGFHRRRKWWESLPFVPPPPNEPSAVPVGLEPGRYVPATP
jgi:HEAT repeat protein